jgi:hypothetical protein
MTHESANSSRHHIPLPGQLVLDFDSQPRIHHLLTVDDIFLRADEPLLRQLNEQRFPERELFGHRFLIVDLGRSLSTLIWGAQA